MAAFLVPWVTQAQLPTSINCTFENDSDATGWVFVNGTQTNQWYIGSATANGGTKSLYISNNGGTSNNYTTSASSLVYAYKDLSLTAGNYYISFDWKVDGESSWDYLRVLLAPASATLTPGQNPLGTTASSAFDSEAPPAGWIDLGGRFNLQSSWQSHFFEFAIATSGDYKLVFFWGNDGSSGDNPPAAVDNIVLAANTCPRPILTELTTTIDSAYLYWSSSLTSFTIEYADSAFTPGMGQAELLTTNDTMIAIENLTPNTEYYYVLYANCDNENSMYTTGTFRTLCVPTSYPLSFGWEDTDSLSSCWAYGRVNSTSSYPALSSTAHNGAYSLYIYSPNSTARYWAALPLVADASLDEMLLSFWVRNSSNSTSNRTVMQVGYMTDVADDSTFVPLANINPNSNTWSRQFVTFPDTITYPEGARIAFMNHPNGATTTNYFYIDDVELMAAINCPIAGDIAVHKTYLSADLSWSYYANSNENTPTAYEVTYAPTNDISNTNSIEVDTTATTLTELTPGTEYQVWVTPLCGENYGSTSTAVFSTLFMPCMAVDSTTIDTVVAGTGTSISSDALFPDYYNYRYQQMLYKAEELDGAANITSIAFQRRSGDNLPVDNIISLEIYLANVTTTTLSTGFVPYNAATFKRVYSRAPYPLTDTGWVEIVLDEPFFYTGDNLLVVVNNGVDDWLEDKNFYYTSVPNSRRYAENDNSPYGTNITVSGSISAYRPNMRFITADCSRFATCAAPIVSVDSISDTAALISWTPGLDETEWNVYYRLAGASVWTEYATGVTDQSILIGGLSGATSYEIGVMTVCDDSVMSITDAFTECGPIYLPQLPYYANVTDVSTGTGNLPLCWNYVPGHSTSYPYIYSYTIGGRSHNLYFSTSSSTNNMIVMPESAIGVDSLELIFEAYKSSASHGGVLIVGIMTDPNYDSTFVPIDTIVVSSVTTWVPIEVNFANYNGTGRYIALRTELAVSQLYGTSSYDYLYLSNIQLHRYSTCRPATAAYDRNTTYQSTTIVAQNPNSDGGSYMLYYGTTNDINAADSVPFIGDSVDLTGLQQSTLYYAWLKVLCTDDVSRITNFSFTTASACFVVENFTAQYSTTNRTAILSWNAPSGGLPATEYAVSYQREGDTVWTSDTIQDNYYYITGVTINTNYLCKLTTLCDGFASYEYTVNFTTGDMCAYVGNEEGYQNAVPFYCYYNYGYSQSIYTASEMSHLGDTIFGIFYTQIDDDAVRMNITYDLYIANTDLDSFANEDAYVPLTGLTQVASNRSMYMNGAGMYYIPFSTPFVRDHSRNIVIAFDNNTGNYQSPAQQWSSTETTSPRTIFTYQDSYDILPASPESGQTGAFVPDVLFSTTCLNPTTCGTPMIICTNSDQTSLDLRWYPGGSETTWTIDYRMTESDTWMTFLPNTTQTNATLTGLNSGLLYEVRISHICDGDTISASGIFSTACGATALPYVESFNAAANGVYARNCWQVGTSNTTENATLPEVGNYTGFGKMVLVDDGAYMIAPTFNVTPNQMQVNMTYYATAIGAFIYVGVVTDPNSIQTFVPIDTIYSYDNLYPTNATVHFNGYTGNGSNICFYMPNGYPTSGGFYLKNLLFDLHSDCPTVDSIWTVSTNNNDVTLAWNTDNIGMASSYIVEYDTAGFTPGTGMVMTANSETVTINNLALSSVYDVYITPICTNGDTMYRSTVYHFQTECSTMSIPYSMNFDLSYLPAVTATQMLPPCWYYDMVIVGTSATTYYGPQIYFSDYASSGSRALYTYYQSVIALPEMNAALDTLQISFHAYATSSSYELQVGVVDSLAPGFAESFVPVATLSCYPAIDTTILFCGYNGTGRYIAFKNTSQYNYAYFHIDDVVVDYRPACTPVVNIERIAAGETMFTLQWDACGTPQGYEVEYGLTGFTQGSGTTVTTTTNTITLTGLQTLTDYDVYIRVNCGANGYSDWTAFTTGTVRCDNMAEVEMWPDGVTAGSTSYIPAYSYYNYSYSQVIYDSAMLVAAGVVPGAEIGSFSFYPLGVGTYSSYYTNTKVYMTNTTKSSYASGTDYETMTSADLVYTGNLNWTEVGWREVIFDSAFVWDGSSNVIITIDRDHGNDVGGSTFKSYQSTDTVYRTLYHYSDGTNMDALNPTASATRTKTMPMYKFTMCGVSQCNAPTVSVATTYNEGTLTWTSNATNFEVAVKAVADAAWPAETAVNNAYTYTATGLTPATEYMYRVRALCEEGETSDWAEGRFTTDSLPCVAPSNLVATAALGTAEMTWTNGGNETAWSIRVWNTAFDQTFSATAQPFTVTGLTPGTEYQAAIAAVCGGGEVTSDFSDTITFTTDICDPVSNVSVTDVSSSYAVVTWNAGENNTGSFMVEYGYEGFAAGTGTTITATTNSVTITGLDYETNYEVYVRAVCENQYNSTWSNGVTFTTTSIDDNECGPVSNVTVDATTITSNSAVVTWTPGINNGNNFEVEYGPAGFSHGDGTTVNVTAANATLTGLLAETAYDVYVRAICDDQNSSIWSTVVTFTTAQIGINTVSGNNQVAIYPNPAENNTTISVSGVEGDVTVTIIDMNGRTISTYTMECSGDCEKMMNVDGLAAGSYFVRLQGNGLNAVKKLVIK